MILKRIFYLVCSRIIFFIPAEFLRSGDQLIRIVFEIIDLGGFKSYFIYSNLGCQPGNVVNLVFIGFNYQELEEYKRGFAFELFFPFYNIPCALKHFIQLSTYTVLLVYIL